MNEAARVSLVLLPNPGARRAIAGLNKGEQTTARIPWLQVRIDRDNELVLRGFSANAVECFAVLGIRFAPDEIRSARLRHQIAFVSRINEHPGAECFSSGHRD